MKYKLIPAALHNFGHSFHSLANYVDDQYIVDIIDDLVRKRPEQNLVIEFPSGRMSPPGEYPLPLVKSIGYWSTTLSKHLASHHIEEGVLSDIRLEFQRPLPRCTVCATDNRGTHYEIPVKKTL